MDDVFCDVVDVGRVDQRVAPLGQIRQMTQFAQIGRMGLPSSCSCSAGRILQRRLQFVLERVAVGEGRGRGVERGGEVDAVLFGRDGRRDHGQVDDVRIEVETAETALRNAGVFLQPAEEALQVVVFVGVGGEVGTVQSETRVAGF